MTKKKKQSDIINLTDLYNQLKSQKIYISDLWVEVSLADYLTSSQIRNGALIQVTLKYLE